MEEGKKNKKIKNKREGGRKMENENKRKKERREKGKGKEKEEEERKKRKKEKKISVASRDPSPQRPAPLLPRADIGRTDPGPPPAHRRAPQVGSRLSSPLLGEASGNRELAPSPAVPSAGTAPPGISIDLWNVVSVRKLKLFPLSLALRQQCKLQISV